MAIQTWYYLLIIYPLRHTNMLQRKPMGLLETSLERQKCDRIGEEFTQYADSIQVQYSTKLWIDRSYTLDFDRSIGMTTKTLMKHGEILYYVRQFLTSSGSFIPGFWMGLVLCEFLLFSLRHHQLHRKAMMLTWVLSPLWNPAEIQT